MQPYSYGRAREAGPPLKIKNLLGSNPQSLPGLPGLGAAPRCGKYGGGAFLVAYGIMLFTVAAPLFFYESVLGLAPPAPGRARDDRGFSFRTSFRPHCGPHFGVFAEGLRIRYILQYSLFQRRRTCCHILPRSWGRSSSGGRPPRAGPRNDGNDNDDNHNHKHNHNHTTTTTTSTVLLLLLLLLLLLHYCYYYYYYYYYYYN